MTIYAESVRIHATALAQGKERAVAIANATKDAIARARLYRDPTLSDKGLEEKRAELEQEFRAAARVDFDKLSKSLSAAQSYLAEQARSHIGITNDAAALIRAEQKWRQVQHRLDAGQENLWTILRTADADTARAIAEFGPSWASAQFDRPGGIDGAVRAWLGETPEDSAAALQRAVYARVATVDPDPSARALFAAAASVEAHLAPARPWLDASRYLIEHGSADILGAAVASRIAESSGSADRTDSATTAEAPA